MPIRPTILLNPFASAYDQITRLRNHLYDIGYKKSIHFETVIISVGNLTVGGTGKTPHVEYLIRLLKNDFRVATLSRGYGRKTKGFKLADHTATAATIGDEPMQFYLKFGNNIVVAVGEERILAIPSILQETNSQIILLDDAFQHRKAERDLNILISDYNFPFYKDFLLPRGRLRERREGAARADAVIVSKCPSVISGEERELIEREITIYTNRGTPVFFTKIKYGAPVPLNNNGSLFQGKILAVSGIARANLFETYLRENYNFSAHIKFKDHHHYSAGDIKAIQAVFGNIAERDKAIIITEKDMVKWQDDHIKELIKDLPVFYLPIEIEFIDEKDRFDALVGETIRKRLKEIEK